MGTMTTDEKDRKLKEIITYCCEQELGDSDKINEILNALVEIYREDDYRHRYDEIARIIISKHTNITQTGETDSLVKVSENLHDVYERAKNNKDINNKNINKEILKKIEKLFVHINLECIRLRNFNDNFKRVSEKIKDYDEKMGHLKQEEQDIKESLKKQQTQYITILGIFASIVLAFVGGLTFSTSVLANIDKASIYRLIFVMSFIALFIGNILYYLFDFLSKIAIRQKEEVPYCEKPIFCFNVIILLIMLIVGTVYLLRMNNDSTIVTDKVKSSGNTRNRIKIPDVREKLEICCIDVAEFLRCERAKFVLE